MEQVIIEFVGDPSGLKPAADAMLAMGKLTKDQYAAFVKANQDYMAATAKATKQQQDFNKGIDAGGKEVKEFHAEFKGLSQTIAAGAVKEVANEFVQLAPKVQATTDKFTSAKKELRELTTALTSGTLTGDELDKAKIRAAQLTDQIADARGEIRAMASDTRAFDLLVEGARAGVAAFSVLQGATALLGEEDEQLQKKMLKVQAAMTTLMGVQEIANVLTTKGGIATKAYGFALQAVEAIQKAFAISSAAAWAVATGGVALLLTGVAYLVTTFESAEDAAEKLAKQEEKLRAQREKDARITIEGYKNLNAEAENAYKKRLLLAVAEEDRLIIEIEQLKQREKLQQANVEGIQKAQIATANNTKTAEEYQKATELVNEAEGKVLDTREKLRAKEEELKKIHEARFSAEMKGQIEAMRAADAIVAGQIALQKILSETREDNEDPFITEKQVEETGENAEAVAEEYRKLYAELKRLQKEREDNERAIGGFIVSTTQEAFDTAFQIGENYRQAELDSAISKLETQKDKQLANKSLTEQQRFQIEEQYRRKVAELKRKDYEQDKQSKIAQAVINGALAVTNILATRPKTDYGIGDYIMIAAAAASTAAQVALISSQPIPQFAKGGKNIPKGMKLVGEEGPELMWTPGGETIIPHADTQKLLARWDIPMPHLPELSPLNNRSANNVEFDYGQMAKSFAGELKRNPMLHVQLDKGGFSTYLITKNSRTQTLNNAYEA